LLIFIIYENFIGLTLLIDKYVDAKVLNKKAPVNSLHAIDTESIRGTGPSDCGLNTYDYGARQDDPVTGRWDRVDPLL
jgi:hypothetical protein